MTRHDKFLAIIYLCLLSGFFQPAQGAQQVLQVTKKTCMTSRSLLTNGFNVWMANRKTLLYLGGTVMTTFLLKYIYHVVRLGQDNKLYKKQYDHPEFQDGFVTFDDYAIKRAPIIDSMIDHAIFLNRARDYALCSILATAIATTSWKPLLAFLPVLLLPRALIEVVQTDKKTYAPNALNTRREQQCLICYCWLSLRQAIRACFNCSKSTQTVAPAARQEA